MVWKEALIWGPTPAKSDLLEWCRLRADFLADSSGVNAQQCFDDLLRQEASFARLTNHEEVVLWFEFDLFCQLNLIYLLGKLHEQDLAGTTLSLVCIDTFRGIDNFRGLGQLTAEQLVSLFPARQALTAKQTELAKLAWSACSSSDPREIELLLAQDTTPLPLLDAALRRHLRRFPSLQNGLGHVEQTVLECIARGVGRFPELFKEWSAAESGYGLGDAQLWDALTRLVQCGRPLLRIEGNNGLGFSGNYPDIGRVAFTLTETGRSILEGKGDLWELEPLEYWLGGVRLAVPGSGWRWDVEQQSLAG